MATSPGPLPLVIGVTGHRNVPPQAIPQLEKRIREVLGEFRALYPTTPLVVLSPLAEGADRIAARAALDAGARLIVPLPLKLDEYEKDFLTASSRGEFAELLARADRSLEIPGAAEFSQRAPGHERDRQYALVGAFVVRCSHLLLALWDGKPSDLTGSTAQVVDYKLQGVPEELMPAHDPLDPPEVGPVYQIVTPRLGAAAPEGQLFDLVTRFPGASSHAQSAEAAFARKLAYFERFNADATQLTAGAGPTGATATPLLPADSLKTISPSLLWSLNAVEPIYLAADALSATFERKSRLAFRLLFAIGFPAALCLQISSRGARFSLDFTIAFLVLLGMGYAVLLRAVKFRDVQNRYQDYRGLAEGLRVQYYWALAGVSDLASYHYLRRQQGDLDWIRLAMRSCEVHLHQTAAGPRHETLALQHWVIDQKNWFTRRVRQRHVQILRIAAAAFELLTVGITLSIIAPVLREMGKGPNPRTSQQVVATAILPLLPLILWMLQSTLQVRKLAKAPAGYHHRSHAAAASQTGSTNLYAISRRGMIWKLLRDSLLTLAVAAVGAIAIHQKWISHPDRLIAEMSITGFAFALAAVFLYAYAEKRGLSMHVKQYTRMVKLLSSAEHAIVEALQAGGTSRAHRMIHAMGREALAQNEEWLLLHRDRPIEIPK